MKYCFKVFYVDGIQELIYGSTMMEVNFVSEKHGKGHGGIRKLVGVNNDSYKDGILI